MFLLAQSSVPWQGKNSILSHIWISLSWWKLQLTSQPKLPLSQRPSVPICFLGVPITLQSLLKGEARAQRGREGTHWEVLIQWCPSAPRPRVSPTVMKMQVWLGEDDIRLGRTLLWVPPYSSRKCSFQVILKHMGVQGETSGSWAGLKSAQIMAPEEQEHKGQKGPVQRSTIKTKSPPGLAPSQL